MRKYENIFLHNYQSQLSMKRANVEVDYIIQKNAVEVSKKHYRFAALKS